MKWDEKWDEMGRDIVKEVEGRRGAVGSENWFKTI